MQRELARDHGEIDNAIARLEGIEGFGWHIAKGRATHEEPLYGVGLTRICKDGISDADFVALGEGETLSDAVDDMLVNHKLKKLHPAPANYLIWSNEHCGWWGRNRSGYVSRVWQAGLYTRDEAIEIVRSATQMQWETGETPHEVAVCIEDLPEDARTLIASTRNGQV